MVMENPKYNQYLWDITGKGIYGVRGKCKGYHNITLDK